MPFDRRFRRQSMIAIAAVATLMASPSMSDVYFRFSSAFSKGASTPAPESQKPEPSIPSASVVRPSEIVVNGQGLDEAQRTLLLRGAFNGTFRISNVSEIVVRYPSPTRLDQIRLFFGPIAVLDAIGAFADAAPLVSVQSTSGNMRSITTGTSATEIRLVPRQAITLTGLEVGEGGVFPPFQ